MRFAEASPTPFPLAASALSLAARALLGPGISNQRFGLREAQGVLLSLSPTTATDASVSLGVQSQLPLAVADCRISRERAIAYTFEQLLGALVKSACSAYGSTSSAGERRVSTLRVFSPFRRRLIVTRSLLTLLRAVRQC